MFRMQKNLLTLLLLVGAIVCFSYRPIACIAGSSTQPYINTELGLRYVPPDGFRDPTDATRQSEAPRPSYGTQKFEVILRMMSSQDDKAPDWATLEITTFPRGRDKDKGDDETAGFITNNALARGATVKREVTRFGGRDFSTTHFEKVEPPLTKYAVVFTTVYKEKFISFYFAGNDRERVLKLTQSMSSVSFKP
jgi:hypothetical protein